MVSPKQERVHVKNSILNILERDQSAVKSVIAASLSLDTGFKKETIISIMDAMVESNLIIYDQDLIKLKALENVKEGE